MTNDTLRALYVLAADYHSGQGSRGYRFLSRVNHMLRDIRGCKHAIYGWDAYRQHPVYVRYQPMAERYF